MKKILCTLTASLAAIGLTANAGNIQINQVYSLGDSLTDVGVYSNFVKLQVPDYPDIQYRFTDNNPNGSTQVWAEVFATKLGLTTTPNVINTDFIGGTAFAEGGSRVSQGAPLLPPYITNIPVTTQVDRLLAQRPTLGANDLILLWAGANDGFANFETYKDSPDPSPGLADMAAQAKILASQVQRLKSAGAQLVVVLTIPNLANTPLGNDPDLTPEQRSLYTSLSQSFNSQLMQSAPQAGALVVDVDKVLNDAILNPTRYGFNPDVFGQTACDGELSLTCLGTNPDNYLFADFVHPSSQAHQLLGQFIFASLQAIPQAETLLTAPLQNIRQQSLSVENRLNMQALSDGTGKLREVGDVHVYGGPEGGYMKTSAQQLLSSIESTSANIDFGVDWMMTRNAVVGVALSYGQMNTKFGGQSGQLKPTVQLAPCMQQSL